MDNKKVIKEIIDYLEEEQKAIESELKAYDATLNKDDLSVQEVDAMILRKRLYDIGRHIRIIRRLSGKI